MKDTLVSLIKKLRPAGQDVQPARQVVKASFKASNGCTAGMSCKAMMDSLLTDLKDFDVRLDRKLNDVCLAERQGE